MLTTFARWLWDDDRIGEPLRGLSKLPTASQTVDRRRERRTLSPAEFARFLVEAAESGPPVVLSRRGRRYERREISGPDRARLYRLAAATGFRANEIRTLTPERFRFGDNPSITVLAQHAKNRREAVQPIGVKFAESIRPWIESLPPDRPILPVPDKTADMLRDDLDAAGIPYVDSRGLTADFHALRVTFITDLARRGVHPAKAQQLARHSDVKLTLGVYTRFADAEIREALEDA